MKKILKLSTTLLLITLFVTPLVGNDNDQKFLQSPEQTTLEASESVPVESQTIEQKQKKSLYKRVRKKLYENRKILAGTALTFLAVYGLYKQWAPEESRKSPVVVQPGRVVVAPTQIPSREEEVGAENVFPADRTRLTTEERRVWNSLYNAIEANQVYEIVRILRKVSDDAAAAKTNGINLKMLMNHRGQKGLTLLHHVVLKVNENSENEISEEQGERRVIDEHTLQSFLEAGADPLVVGVGELITIDGATMGAWCSNGDRILVCDALQNTASVLNAFTGRHITTVRHDGMIKSIAWSPDGTRILTGSCDKSAKIWDAITGRLITMFGCASSVTSVAWSSDGTRILTGGWVGNRDGFVKIWDASTGGLITSIMYGCYVNAVAWSPDGSRILVGGMDHNAKILDVATGRVITTLRHKSVINAVAWSHDGTRVLTGSSDRTAKVWDVATGKEITTLKHEGLVQSVAWSPDGTRVFTGSWDNTAKIWDAATGRVITTLRHESWITSTEWSLVGNRILVGRWDKVVRIIGAVSPIDLASSLELQELVSRFMVNLAIRRQLSQQEPETEQ